MMGYTKIGDIAVVRIPDELDSKEQDIARYILKNDHSIEVVLRTYGRYGEFRKQKIKLLVGSRTHTTHKEHGVVLQLDVKEVYFSEREKTERQRLKSLVSDQEEILVLFAGVGIIPLVIAKEKYVKITAIEKNEKAFAYMKENILLNQLKGSIIPVLQDVYTLEKTEFDRVIAPQPYKHHSFDVVSKFVRKKGILHYYTWLGPDQKLQPFPGFSIINTETVSSYAPRVYKVCVDMERM